VRIAGYGIVDRYRRANDRGGFQARIDEFVQAENAATIQPLSNRECAGIAKSIAGWTWACYKSGATVTRGRRTASVRSRGEYLAGAAAARSEARALHSDGVGASEIARRMKRSKSWVYSAIKAGVQCALSGIGESVRAIEPSVGNVTRNVPTALLDARTLICRTVARFAIAFVPRADLTASRATPISVRGARLRPARASPSFSNSLAHAS
jgi:hypothetical protein